MGDIMQPLDSLHKIISVCTTSAKLRRVSKGGAFGACAPPLSLMPNEKSTEIKTFDGTDSAKIAIILKMSFFFFAKDILLSLLFNLE